jgi:hypothetical protein
MLAWRHALSSLLPGCRAGGRDRWRRPEPGADAIAPPADLATALADERMVAGTYTSTRGFATNLLSGLTVLLESSVDINPKDSTIRSRISKG